MLPSRHRQRPRGTAPIRAVISTIFLLCCLPLPGAQSATVVLSEFMASNSGFLRDADGDSPDWIELHNRSADPVNLDGWFLTDLATVPALWRFPATNLAPDARIVVFASGKDRAVPGLPLHTSFQLVGSGEYLGLFDAGTNVVSEFKPNFPAQVANVSYGFVYSNAVQTLVGPGTPLRFFIPNDGTLGTNWIQPSFDDTTWIRGTNGIGYDRNPGVAIDFTPFIATDLTSRLFDQGTGCWVRMPFVVDDPGRFSNWDLALQFDDGFHLWLNGTPLGGVNVPEPLDWNSAASDIRPDADAIVPTDFPLGSVSERIQPGTNWLAIHALNATRNSADFLFRATLTAEGGAPGVGIPRYFPKPSPGTANTGGVEQPGPVVEELRHEPVLPTDTDDVTVLVRLRPTFAPVTGATLVYRTQYSNEVTVAMFDDGTHQDDAAGDNVFAATIPAAASNPGQMLRYRVVAKDALGRESRWPLYLDPKGSAQYQGTVIAAPGVTSALPVLQWFIEKPSLADTDLGTRCSVFYAGEFYDNQYVRVRGGTSRAWPKHSYKFEFNEGENFRLHPILPRLSEFDLNTTYTDKSYLRAVLTYEHQRAAGQPSPEILPVRVQQNGSFFSVALLTEQPDTDFLRRWDMDPSGALYKGGPGSNAESTSSYEKKTRRTEPKTDLQTFLNGLRLTGTNLENFVFDNIDVPGQVNYMATVAVTQNIDGSDKNYFLYRDTNGSREWRMLPWDLDLTFGPNALNTDTMVYRENYASHPYIGARPFLLHDGKYNRILEAIVKVPRTREMLLRRIRTLADETLPTGWFSNRIDQLIPLLQPDITLDRAKWKGNANFGGAQDTLLQANNRIKAEYLSKRHGFLISKTIPGILSTNPPPQPGDIGVQFGAVDANPVSGRQSEEYLTLINTNAIAVDLTGWSVDGEVRHEFKPGTVIPASGTLYVSPDASAFRSRTDGPKGAQGLFVQGNYRGQLTARGGRLSLKNPAGTEVAALVYEGQPTVFQRQLRIAEIMFAPPNLPFDTFDAEQYEFLRLINLGPESLDLTGVQFATGIAFIITRSPTALLQPGQSLYVARNLEAFAARYGHLPNVVGPYLGALDNAGERLRLVDPVGEEILDFTYADDWEPTADGAGYSIVARLQTLDPAAWNAPSTWDASPLPLGSPASLDTDGDGLSNTDERLAGTDPNDATSSLRIERARWISPAVRLEFRAIAGRPYRLLARDGQDGPWVTISTVTARPATETITLTDAPSDGVPRYYRLATP